MYGKGVEKLAFSFPSDRAQAPGGSVSSFYFLSLSLLFTTSSAGLAKRTNELTRAHLRTRTCTTNTNMRAHSHTDSNTH